MAERQTSDVDEGGELGRWYRKGIAMSILLRPNIDPGNIQAITLAASSAVCKAIESCTQLKPGIKWPNDIQLNGKKVCGILTEMTAEPDKIHSVIVGIGLNVSQEEKDFTDEVKDTVTSIALNGHTDTSRSTLTARILEEFEELYLDYVEKRSTAKFLNIWRSFSSTIGCDIIIHQGEKLGRQGQWMLDDGCLGGNRRRQRQAISSGEISIRKKS